MNKKVKFSLNKRILLLTLSSVILVSAILAVVNIRLTNNSLRDFISKKNSVALQNLATLIETPLIEENYVLMLELVDSAVKTQQISSLWVCDDNGNILVSNHPRQTELKIDPMYSNSLDFLKIDITKKGSVNMLSDYGIIDTLQNEVLLAVLITLTIVIVVITLLSFLISKRITKPIIDASQMLQVITVNKDLTKVLKISSGDEIGVLSQHFNDFISSLNKTIGVIKEVTDNTKLISDNLATTSEESSSALSQMKDNIEGIKEKVNLLDREIHQTNTIASEVRDYINDVSQLINTQATVITESSSAIKEMSVSVGKIALSSEAKLSVVNDLERTALKGEVEMNKTMEIIKKVADSANIIMEMIKVINSISEQTNLLAMNAAIEAAHAGTAGKGFAVVADEIRKLSESSNKNASEISRSLKAVIDDIHVSENLTSKTGEFFTKIVNEIKEVASSMLEIKMGMEELSSGSNQIEKSLGSIIEITDNVKSSSKEMDKKVQKMSSSTSAITAISNDTRNGMADLASAALEMIKAVENVSISGQQNSEAVTRLELLMNEFQIHEQGSLAIK